MEEQELPDLLARRAGRRRRRRLMRWCSSAHPPAYAALHSSGSADDPACHWLYDTLLFPDPDLRLASASLQPVWQAAAVSLASLYGRARASPPPSSRHGARRLADGAPAVGRRSRRRSSRRRGPAVGGAGVHQRRGSGAGVDQRPAQDAGEGHSGGRGRQAAGVDSGGEGRERDARARRYPLDPAASDLAVFASVAGQTRSTSAQNKLNRAQVSKLSGIRS